MKDETLKSKNPNGLFTFPNERAENKQKES